MGIYIRTKRKKTLQVQCLFRLSINLFFVSSEGFGEEGSLSNIGSRNRILTSESGDFRAPVGSLAREIVTLFLRKYQTVKIALGKLYGRMSTLG